MTNIFEHILETHNDGRKTSAFVSIDIITESGVKVWDFRFRDIQEIKVFAMQLIACAENPEKIGDINEKQ